MVAEAALSVIAAGVLASFKTASKNGRGIKPVPLAPSRSGISTSANAPLAQAPLLGFSLLIPAASLTEPPIDGLRDKRQRRGPCGNWCSLVRSRSSPCWCTAHLQVADRV